MREAFEKAERRYDESHRALEKLEEDYAQEEQKINEVTEKFSNLEPRYNKAVEHAASLTKREQELATQLDSYQKEYRNAEHNTSKSTNKTVEKLMEEKQSGRIPGICGQLGDLGNIDPKYDDEISTTTNLEYIITDTYETTKQCLAYMEKHQLPRITFLS